MLRLVRHLVCRDRPVTLRAKRPFLLEGHRSASCRGSSDASPVSACLLTTDTFNSKTLSRKNRPTRVATRVAEPTYGVIMLLPVSACRSSGLEL